MIQRYVKGWLISLMLFGAVAAMTIALAKEPNMLIDDFSRADLVSPLGTMWRSISDQVMGGVSQGKVSRCATEDSPCLRLTGDVSLENNGGFIQASLDLTEDGSALDASSFKGIRLVVRGNEETYGLHLRTGDVTRPWQSYRTEFSAEKDWNVVELPFSNFLPHRIDAPLNTHKLRRLGLVAIGRAFHADLSVKRLEFYR